MVTIERGTPQMRRVLTVFVASPGDVGDERKALGVVASRINRITARDWGWEIDLRGWEDTLPGHARPQSLINPDVEACDVFIGVLWKRWGTETGTHTSGFEEEFLLAKSLADTGNGPEIMLYLRDIDASSQQDPGPQLKKVLDFRREVTGSRQLLYQTYGSLSEFEVLLFDHLMKTLGRYALGGDEKAGATASQSPEAHDLLASTTREITASTLLDLVSDPLMTDRRLADRWQQARETPNIPMLPCAVGPNGLYHFDLFQPHHYATLLVGTTGSGKTEALLSIAASSMLAIPPDLLRVTFVDLKFASYALHLEDIGAEALTTDDSDAPLGLSSILSEMDRRAQVLKEFRCRDFREFWTTHAAERHRLPFWLVCIDEVAGVTFGQAEGLARLTALIPSSGPLGIHFVLGAQRTSGIGSMIRAVTSRRICLRTGDTAESLDIVGVPEAAFLPRASPGMAIIREGTDHPARMVRFAQSDAMGGRELGEIFRLARERYFEGAATTGVATHGSS